MYLVDYEQTEAIAKDFHVSGRTGKSRHSDGFLHSTAVTVLTDRSPRGLAERFYPLG
jgi:cytochrome oxidase Cu insertion factor (SCO1/SenC/PrrC family)